jgi:hypothetical protein
VGQEQGDAYCDVAKRKSRFRSMIQYDARAKEEYEAT